MFDAARRLVSSIRGIKRVAVCGACGTKTIQTRHGYTAEGRLWKGHVCECRGWHCQSCQTVMDQAAPCCR
jgi:hypothetical protein